MAVQPGYLLSDRISNANYGITGFEKQTVMRKNRTIGKLLMLCLAAIIVSCTSSTEDSISDDVALESAKANAYFERAFDRRAKLSPEYQSFLGIKENYDKWDKMSEEASKKELEIAKEELQFLLDSINPEKLDHQTSISYKLFKANAENEIADFEWRHHDYPVNQMFGRHSYVTSFLINIHRVANKSDAEAYISRLNGVEQVMDELIIQLQIREEKGIMPPKFVFPMAIEVCENVLKGAPFVGESPSTLLADFSNKVNALELEQSEKDAMIESAKKALVESVKPGYQKLITFLEGQERRATTDDGVWKLPDGAAFYDNALKRTTTTDLTGEQIHQIGLLEVDRIHNEMRTIMDQVGFEGTLQEFFIFLKTDDQFYYPNTDEGKQQYLDSATTIIDNMRSRLDELFYVKPKAELVVKRVEAYRESSAAKAFYQRPAADGSRPGTYYANLADTRNMPKFEMEALAYHEGIPGHHMDRAISQELTGVPKFRKFGSYTAFVEGWGLYSEFIPKEMGLYTNPYSDYGRLAMELWRACRLVVDTGIHLKQWTREDGIKYYTENTSGSEREIRRMVERHIVLPSQATAYKIGMLKMLELRQKAKEELGDQFDIRDFHDVVLTNGAVPLDVLEELVNEYIASKAA